MRETDWAGVDGLIVPRHGAAQLCVIHRGRLVADHYYNCRVGSLFWLFSASKPLVALAVHLLAERGQLSLDEPVASYWPQFAQRGKQAITVRQVLQHRGGLPVARSMAADALSMSDWDASIRAIENAKPSLPPGEGPAYHILSFGFILGELVQRVSGVPLTEFVQTEFLDPLRLRDSFLGLPAEQLHRSVPVHGRDPARRISQFVINQPRTRQAVIPAAGLSSTARDVALLYQALLDGDVVAPSTLAVATAPSTDGELDRFLKLPVRWAAGFQLGGERDALGGSGAMGALASWKTFGHNGSYACLAWADPEQQLVMAYLTNLLVTRAAGTRHMAAVSDAVRAVCRQ
ncbi:MAG TPA: serine hydrolase domain-containing protein [Streptosporangiaceae bacterium]|nr:serine hydrolase domain-containing protein [Streptosporangiaceae bacterium]